MNEIDRQIRTIEWTDRRWMDVWTDVCMDRWMDGWMVDGWMDK